MVFPTCTKLVQLYIMIYTFLKHGPPISGYYSHVSLHSTPMDRVLNFETLSENLNMDIASELWVLCDDSDWNRGVQ